MKTKLFLMIALVATTTLFVACDKKEAKEEKSTKSETVKNTAASAEDIEEAKKIIKEETAIAAEMLVGKQVDFMTTSTGITFDGKNVTYAYEIDESQLEGLGYTNISQLDWEEAKKLQQKILEENENSQAFLNSIKLLGGTINYVYVGSISHETISYSLW